jgi:ArsR family transcriptional regulator
MPDRSRLVCRRVGPSAVAELAWLLDLLVQAAHYAEPALAELDASLLPGVAALRSTIKGRFRLLWDDPIAGCPELLAAAGAGGCLDEVDIARLLAWFTTKPKGSPGRYTLSSEPTSDRRWIRRRLTRLHTDIRLRRQYRNLLAEVWEMAASAWERPGRIVVARASAEWRRRLAGATSVSRLISLMPPRHPLVGGDGSAAARMLQRRGRYDLVPTYFCMSGGAATDLGHTVLIGVPASALEPVRRSRDAAFVADRARVLAEPTRVRILIYLMSTPSGVMEVVRALRISQPSVSEHVRVLSEAGMVRRERKGTRTIYRASPRRIERALEDAKATLARWAVEDPPAYPSKPASARRTESNGKRDSSLFS